MQPIIACFLLVLVSATVAYGKGDCWSKFVIPGCEEYVKALMDKAKETGAMEEFKECKEKESEEDKKQCFWNIGMGLVDACDATPSEACIENVKKVFKMA